MRRFVAYGTEGFLESRYGREMLGDRRKEFIEKRQWGLTVDATGCERDCYDGPSATYVCVADENGRHKGSARLLPMNGSNMAADVFPSLFNQECFGEAQTWEVSRFLGSPGSGTSVFRQIMLAGLEFAARNQITSYLGVTTPLMMRVHARLGWAPEKLRGGISAEGRIVSCRWNVTPDLTTRMRDLTLRDQRNLEDAAQDIARPADVSA